MRRGVGVERQLCLILHRELLNIASSGGYLKMP